MHVRWGRYCSRPGFAGWGVGGGVRVLRGSLSICYPTSRGTRVCCEEPVRNRQSVKHKVLIFSARSFVFSSRLCV